MDKTVEKIQNAQNVKSILNSKSNPNDFQNLNKIWNTLGTFWSSIPEMKSILQGLILLQNQNDLKFQELLNSLSRHDINVFRTETWYPVKVIEREYSKTFETSPDIIGEIDSKHYSIEIPEKLHTAQYVTDSINSPSWKVEYLGENTTIPDMKRSQVWLFNAKFDEDDIYHQFGYAIPLRLKSSEEYKALVNAYLDGIIHGATYETVKRFILAMMGHVQKSETENGSEPDNINIIEWNATFPGLTLPKNLTGLCENITLPNESLPVKLSTENGFTRIDIENLSKLLFDFIHQSGMDKVITITDECELHKIYKLLKIKKPESVEPKPDRTPSGNGLSTYMLHHRWL